MRIITITLNPAFDVHCTGKALALYHENFVDTASVDAGGKGINLSRALLANGIANETLVVVGRENAVPYEQALAAGGLTVISIPAEGRIRENITIHEADRPETRISFSGFSCDKAVLREAEKRIGAVDENTIVAFTGSAPKGIEADDILDFLGTFRAQGAKIIIDSRSVPFRKLTAFQPWLIKPNQEEASLFAGHPVTDRKDAVRFAGELYRAGISNVLLTFGGDGAVYACDKGIFRATVPEIAVKSTIGAGDSTIAGFIDGTMQGLSAEDVLRLAMAYGAAACLQEGTRPPRSEEIKAIGKLVSVTAL